MSFADLQGLTLFGNELIDFNTLGEMLLRFGINLLVILIIIRWIYYPIYKERSYFFTNIVINVSIFFVCFLLNTVKLKIGFAFGLFAVLAIIRYRTQQIPIRDMTYLFVSIIVAVINSLSTKKVVTYAEVMVANFTIIIVILLFEKFLIRQDDVLRISSYEKIDLIKPENYDRLLMDLKERTGLEIYQVEVERINFLNDTARLKIFYKRVDLPTRAESA